MVAHVNTPEYPFYLSMACQTTWLQQQRKCEMPQLIKTKSNVYQAALLPPIHVINLHDILECPK